MGWWWIYDVLLSKIMSQLYSTPRSPDHPLEMAKIIEKRGKIFQTPILLKKQNFRSLQRSYILGLDLLSGMKVIELCFGRRGNRLLPPGVP